MNPRNISIFLGTLLLLAILWGVFQWPTPYDESLYRNFSFQFAQTGKPWIPELPNGYFLVFHPYLILGLQALLIKLGFFSLLSFRIFHFFLWVIPTIWFTWKLAKDLFNEHVALFTILTLLTIGFFQTESYTAEMDLPYSAITVLSLWLTYRWHESILPNKTLNNYWFWLTTVLCVGMWIKLQCWIPVGTSFFLTALFAFQKEPSLRKKLLASIFLTLVLAAFSFSVWLLTAYHLGAPLIEKFQFVISGLMGYNPVYQSKVSQYSWPRYVLFLTAFIQPTLLAVAFSGLAIGICKRTFNLWYFYLCVPLGLILTTLLLSGIREARYFVPALPLLAILSGLFFQHLWQLPWNRFYKIGVVCILIFSLFISSKHHFSWLIEPMNQREKEISSVSLYLRKLCVKQETFTLSRQALAFGLSCPYYPTDFLKSWQKKPILWNDYWVAEVAGPTPEWVKVEYEKIETPFQHFIFLKKRTRFKSL